MFDLPFLNYGGIIIGYQCSIKCRHCLYKCSSKDSAWINETMIHNIIHFLKKYIDGHMHIGGGEPFLKTDIILNLVTNLLKNDIKIDYLETNGYWGNKNEMEGILIKFHNIGLKRMLISLSPFHNEFIPLSITMNAIKMAQNIFGEDNIVVWSSEYMKYMFPFEHNETISFENYMDRYNYEVKNFVKIYKLTLNGRVPYKLQELFILKPAQALWDRNCYNSLLNPNNFHIDLYGNLITGLCSGLSLCNILHIKNNKFEISNRPILKCLIDHGIEGLYNLAIQNGYSVNKYGYISKCHLCDDIKKFFYKIGNFKELQPKEYYEL